MLWFVTLDWRFKKSQNRFLTLNWSSKTSRTGLKNVFRWILDTPQYYCQFFVSSFLRIHQFFSKFQKPKTNGFSWGFSFGNARFFLVANPTCFFFFSTLRWKKLGIFITSWIRSHDDLWHQSRSLGQELEVIFSRFLGRKATTRFSK